MCNECVGVGAPPTRTKVYAGKKYIEELLTETVECVNLVENN